ncbi:MBL fold metallo-hydrolase [Blastococcus sp. TML/M2B]|uniref:MBL fold metallo-hydrolase n=1 Tax=unclassified Blastococcus TaxID=2619396 RepID=UPI00190E5836|nr:MULTISPECIES: MBL fold metallo-hydrolase [unclassified Blastococcus]MBN1093056.1 MBL fold metallo-hydrolase [Blastococcus sp. TML/M2B]MBN1096826.1 MBL fold metallo-hydrolase [Blastococcus sp. TML/C7B]
MWTRDNAPPSVGDPSSQTERATLVLAPNANAWTFEGTNTWLLAEPGADVCAVVDPGPDDDAHLAAILAAAGDRRIVGVWVTHAHTDHAELAGRLARVTGAPLRGSGRRVAGRPFQPGEVLPVGPLEVRVLATPGHTGDSVCFHLPAEGSVLTGDTVLGRGAPIVEPGRLGQFFASLDLLSEVLAPAGSVILPGHGPVLPDPLPELGRRRQARQRRVDQVARAMADGLTEPDALVDHMYPDLSPDLRDAARISVEASIAHVQTARS